AVSDHEFVRDNFVRQMEDPHSLVVVVGPSSAPTGFLALNPDPHFDDTVVIGIASVSAASRHHGAGTAMLNLALAWAREAGYQYCSVEWTSPNLVSDRFWRTRGFTPVQYKLSRRIDPSVAWADASLSYEHIRPVNL